MVRIITDSTCDLDPAYTAARGITVLPLTVSFGEEHFRDGVDLTREEFYRRLEEGSVLPKTTQITPAEFQEAFVQELVTAEEVVFIGISSGLSGTCQSAEIARTLMDGDPRIHLVDSGSVTGGLGHLVKVAADLRDAGLSGSDIRAELLRLVPRMRFFAAVNTLKYLKLGGRISGAAAVVGGIMGIRPIISMEGGKIFSAGKVRSVEAGQKWLMKKLEEEPPALEYGLCFTYSLDPAAMEGFRTMALERYPVEDTLVCSIGSVVGTYGGPGAFGVMYIEQE